MPVPTWLTITAVAAAACGGGDTAAAQQPAARKPLPAYVKDPCALLTQAEAEAIVGPLTGAPALAEYSTRACEYKPKTGKPFWLGWEIHGSSPREWANILKESAKQADDEMEDVSGVGEAALYSELNGWRILKNGKTLVILFLDDRPTAIKVANKAMERF
jgi:hypothetical protein